MYTIDEVIYMHIFLLIEQSLYQKNLTYCYYVHFIITISFKFSVYTSNSMGSSEIWDKYHDCCIGNGDKFHEAKPMLFPVNTIPAAYTHAVH